MSPNTDEQQTGTPKARLFSVLPAACSSTSEIRGVNNTFPGRLLLQHSWENLTGNASERGWWEGGDGAAAWYSRFPLGRWLSPRY